MYLPRVLVQGSVPPSLPHSRADSYQLTGAHVTDHTRIHPEAIGEGGFQVDVAPLVFFRQLAHMCPVYVLHCPKLDIVCALQGSQCQQRWTVAL